MSLAIASRAAAFWSESLGGNTPGESRRSSSPPMRTHRRLRVTPGCSGTSDFCEKQILKPGFSLYRFQGLKPGAFKLPDNWIQHVTAPPGRGALAQAFDLVRRLMSAV
jgi:hypothetical protein